MEAFEVKKYYKWFEGPYKGAVEEYVCEDDDRVWFSSGSSAPKEDLVTKLHECSEGEYRAYQSQVSVMQASTQPEQFKEWESMLGNDTPSNTSAPEPVKLVEEKSPIRIILEKQKKMSKLNLNFVLEDLDFPSPKVMEFMTMMFDEDEVVDEITEFVFSQMTQEEIHGCIKNSIRNHITTISENSAE